MENRTGQQFPKNANNNSGIARKVLGIDLVSKILRRVPPPSQ
jgi:hypothetical protein